MMTCSGNWRKLQTAMLKERRTSMPWQKMHIEKSRILNRRIALYRSVLLSVTLHLDHIVASASSAVLCPVLCSHTGIYWNTKSAC